MFQTFNRRYVISFLIAIISYALFFNNFFSKHISKNLDIHMILLFIYSYYIYLILYFVAKRSFEPRHYSVFKVLYLILLITLFFSRDPRTSFGFYNYSTFNLDVKHIVYNTTTSSGILFIIMNVLLLIPLGYMFRKELLVIKLIAPIIIFTTVEFVQRSNNLGVFDINDIILNSIGFYIGSIGIYYLLRRK